MGNTNNTIEKLAVREETDESRFEEIKWNLNDEETCMGYVNKYRDFSRVGEGDLEAVFPVLRERCAGTWNLQLESRARNFNRKIETLLTDNLEKYVDPELTAVEDFKAEPSETAKDLMTVPVLWNMNRKEAAVELREILRHFTMFAPFKGRPFIRKWFVALIPCFSRWLLQSDSQDNLLVETLKHFLGAFSQPGIVICLENMGSSSLRTLKESARAVQALGRGIVERYYWKRLAESSCGGSKEWQELANIPNMELELSQLDTLPPNWLLDTGDWAHLFANVISPEITNRFELLIKDAVAANKYAEVRVGPPKTLARSIAKSYEYKSEYRHEKNKRWSRFTERFRDVFQRDPRKSNDFVLNIVDFARCSIVVPSASQLLKVKKLIEERFSIVALKNGYSSAINAKGSGYRDLKLLVKVQFDNLKLGNIPIVEDKIELICEIQLICEKWLQNKKTTSLSYKVLRSTNLRNFLSDFAKYLQPQKGSHRKIKLDPISVLENGQRNLGKYTDFSSIEPDKIFFESVENGWDSIGVEMLVNELGANPDSVDDATGLTVVSHAAEKGHYKVIETMIRLKSDINATDGRGFTPLQRASRCGNIECLHVLLKAGADVPRGEIANISRLHQIIPNVELILEMLSGKDMSPSIRQRKKDNKLSMIEEVKTAAVEGSLASYFDTHDMKLSIISELLSLPVILKKIENILQVIWLGGNVNGTPEVIPPLGVAILLGLTNTVKVLLSAKASINFKIDGIMRRTFQRPGLYNVDEIVEDLLEAKANPGDERLRFRFEIEWTALHCALFGARCRDKVRARLKEARMKIFQDRVRAIKVD